MTLRDKILKATEKQFGEILEIRRHLHANPELSHQEKNTSEYLKSKLEFQGFEINEIKKGHGFFVELQGQNKKVLALRADMDALPIQETGNAAYASKVPGVMHACGHDAHSAMLFGAASVLAEFKNEMPLSGRFIFQPAEEKVPSGARVMIEEGVLENPAVEGAFAQHVTPELATGKVGFHAGPFMASADEIYITVKGRGGHASKQSELVDPILIASHLIIELRSLLKGQEPVPSLLSFGDIRGLGATNIIPNEVKIQGTLRTFDEDWRAELLQEIQARAKRLCQELGGDCEVIIPEGIPFLKNDEHLTERAHELTVELLGANNVVEMPQRMGAEDFAYFTQAVPSCLWRLGTGSDSKKYTGLHTPTFDIDEDSLRIGASLMAWLGLRFGG